MRSGSTILLQHTDASLTWVSLMSVHMPQIDEFLKTGTIGVARGGGGGGSAAKADVKTDAAMAANFL